MRIRKRVRQGKTTGLSTTALLGSFDNIFTLGGHRADQNTLVCYQNKIALVKKIIRNAGEEPSPERCDRIGHTQFQQDAEIRGQTTGLERSNDLRRKEGDAHPNHL